MVAVAIEGVERMMEFLRRTQRCKLQLSLLPTEKCSLERAKLKRFVGCVEGIDEDAM